MKAKMTEGEIEKTAMENYEKQLEEITEKLGDYTVNKGGRELRFAKCPICQKYSPDNPHFSINTVSGVYKCFVSDKGGHINQLKGFEYLDTYKLAEFTRGKVKSKKTPGELKGIFEKTISILKNKEWVEYLKGRGISEETFLNVAMLDSRNRLSIPLINENKKLVGIKYRTLEKKPSCESGSNTSYFINWQKLKGEESLIIVEGEIDLMSAIESGFNNVVSLPFGASNLKVIDHQREWLKSFKSIIIAVDNDEAGQKCKRGIIEKLKDSGLKLYEVDLGEFKDLNEVLMSKGVRAVKKILEEPKEIIIKEEEDKIDIKKLVDSFAKLPLSEKYDCAEKILFYFRKQFKKINNLVYFKKDNYYLRMGIDTFLDSIATAERITFSKALKEELTKIIKYGIEGENFPEEQDSLIAFKDCVFNICSGKIEKSDDKFVYWATDYTLKEVMENKTEYWKKHFKEKLGEEQTKVLLGFLYLSMLSKHNRYILLYYSEGRDGKGTLFQSLGKLFEKTGNIGVFNPEVFSKEFNLYNLYLKDIAVIDEAVKIPVETAKQISGNRKVQAEKKSVQAVEIEHNASLVFLSNNPISMRSFDKAEKQRFIMIKHLTSNQVPDDSIAENLFDNRAELLGLILTDGRDYYKETKGNIIFHNPEMLEEYEELNNPIEFLIRNHFEVGDLEENYITYSELEEFIIAQDYLREWEGMNRTAKGNMIKRITGKKSKNITRKGIADRIIALKLKTSY